MPNWEEIQKEWEATKITFRALAEKHDVKEGTLKSRRSREKWTRNKDATHATNQTDATVKNKRDATKEKTDDKGVKKKSSSNSEVKELGNRSGNPNPKNQFTERNSINTKHGLFSKYLRTEQIEIIEAMEDMNLADQLWFQIELTLTSIIRMQKIMGVDNEWDHLKEESGSSNSFDGDSVSYKVIYAHERFESYVRAQSRAMAEYRNLARQYIELTDEFDERRLKLEGMQVSIDKTKVETEQITKDAKNDAPPIITIVDAWSDTDG